MSTAVKIEDIVFVSGELEKLFKSNYDNFNDWEKGFLRDISGLIELNMPLSKRQLFFLYKTYYKHVEGDEDELEDWCREHGFMGLYYTYVNTTA